MCDLARASVHVSFQAGEGERVAYYFIAIILYQTGFAGYQVPYTSLTMHLSDEPRERDSGTLVRAIFDVMSALFASVFQGNAAVPCCVNVTRM